MPSIGRSYLGPSRLRASRPHAVTVLAASPPSTSASKASRLLVLNAGSSSLKFKTFTLNADTGLEAGLGGVFERIGDVGNSCLLAKGLDASGQKQKWDIKVPAKDHVAAMASILAFLSEHVSSDMEHEVMAVGHRVVHGLQINQPVLLAEDVINTIKKGAVLAPLHNPAALQGIQAASAVFPAVPQVGVFDTAFHASMPAEAFMYGVPYELYEQHAIRRYGFHGTSHGYLVQQAAKVLKKPEIQVNVITCHLGNGSSITAVRNGISVDTSMGMTPLEGVVMGTRCGDLDPAVVLHLQTELGLSIKETDTLLNKKSGLLGLCGNNDLRSVIEMSDAGDPRGVLALNIFVYRIRKYIGSYMAALGGDVDAVIFSAGIGENSSLIRSLVCQGMQNMGISVDEAKNKASVGVLSDISAPGSRIKVMVIPTDEELSIAQQTLKVVRG